MSLNQGSLQQRRHDVPVSTGDQATGASGEASPDRLSLPLYLSGCVGTVAALSAINYTLDIPALTLTSVTLAILGFVFSYMCRWAGISAKVISWLAVGVAATLLILLVAGRITIAALLPATQGQGDLQLAAALEWMAVIYTWTLSDDRRVVMSSILAIAMIGLVGAYNVDTNIVVSFLVYTISTLFLLIHQNYLLHWPWGRMEADPVSKRLVGMQIILSGACGLLITLAGLVLVVPLQAVGSHLSLGTALKGLLFASTTKADTASGSAQSSAFSDSATFPIGQGGNQFSESDLVVMHAYPSDGQMHYWRGNTYDRYSAQGWSSSQSQPEMPLPASGVDPLSGIAAYPIPSLYADTGRPREEKSQHLVTVFDIVNGMTDTIYAPPSPVQIALPVRFAYSVHLTASQDGRISLDRPASGFSYSIATLSDDDTDIADLRHAKPGVIPSDIQQLYVQQYGSDVPEADRARLAATAQKIVSSLPADQQDEYDKASAIRAWVSSAAKYSLDVNPTPPGQDAVSYFLFTSKIGYCDLFASSMAILCRYAGIPARVATGFAPGEDRRRGGFNIRVKDKHAWCEVYFPGYGWRTFDPTSGTAVVHPPTGTAKLVAELRSLWTQVVHFFRSNGPVPIIIAVVVLICLAYIAKTEVIDRILSSRSLQREKSQAPGAARDEDAEFAALARSSARKRWRDVLRLLERWGLRQQSSETAREFAARCASRFASVSTAMTDDGASHWQATDALSLLAQDYLTARYAGESDPIPTLIARERDGSADKDLKIVEEFIAAGRATARRMPHEWDGGMSESEAREKTPTGVA